MLFCKHYLYLCLIVLLLCGCTEERDAITLCITNDTQRDRTSETVEVPLDELFQLFTPAEGTEFCVSTVSGKPILCQQTSDNKLIFLANVKAKASSRYVIGIRKKINRQASKNGDSIRKILSDTLLHTPNNFVFYTVIDNGPLRYTIKTGTKPALQSYKDTQILEIRTTQYDADANTTSVVYQYNCLPQSKKSLHKQAPLRFILE